ncbi:MAG: TonB-dependent receptor [Novosphingobium sp.]|nr:TonB-dependent receptor [Novosphingobium sp.]
MPGFTFEGASGNAPIYSIRGVGFHDLSLASGQAVAVYADETPIPFGYETIGVDFDVERVEVLKGPQGTLFGQNSTGGAINYVMAKPTANLEYGLNLTYGRFNTTDISGFVSGPLSDTLRARVAVRSIQGDGWQKRYGPVPNQLQGPADDTIGRQNQLGGRILLEWRPTSDFKVLLNVNTRRDRSDTQVPQFNGLRPSSSQPVVPEILAFRCRPKTTGPLPGIRIDYAQNNRWAEASARIEYDAGAATITSLTAYQRYKRYAPAREHDGTPYPALRYGYRGDVETFYQELRAGGTFGGEGSWLVGANYEHDKTKELFHTYNPLATSRLLFGLPNLSSGSKSDNQIKTYGIFGNVEYPLSESLSIQVGARYTKADRNTQGCSLDDNGGLAAIFTAIQTNLVNAGVKKTPIVTPQVGGCITLDPTATPALFKGELNEDNVSWRVGLNSTAAPGTPVLCERQQGLQGGQLSAGLRDLLRPIYPGSAGRPAGLRGGREVARLAELAV